MADGLDIVAGGIHEGTAIIRVIMRAEARRAVVLAAGSKGRAMEGIDRRTRAPIQKGGLPLWKSSGLPPGTPKPSAALWPVCSPGISRTMA